MRILIFILLFSISSFAQNKQYIHDGWKFKLENSKEIFQAKVPGTVHQDLMRVGMIDNIYYENNEHKYRWIEEKNWKYQTTFSVDTATYNYAVHNLVFEGIDTYGDVYLNDSLILEANNMFRTWRVDVHEIIKLGDNELKVKFTSPILKNQERVKNSPYVLPAGCETVETKVSPYTRKAGYHFGWDWCPRIVTCGIWKDVYLETSWGATISDINVVTEDVRNDTAWIRYDIELALSDKASIQNLAIELNNLTQVMDLGMNENKFSFKRVIPDAKLWWPNGYGKPNLHHDTITLKIQHNEIDKKAFRYGIRKIELIDEPDSIGFSFFFKVNNQPVFIKGANYIPQDMLLPRVTNQQYKELLLKAAQANMNMLRVWGGGIYEKDIFYNYCDQMGIMVWQDFMFAGSMYPGDSAFMNNVKAEVRDNIKRLRKYPCLAVWCGNNEMEVAWNNWGWQKQYDYSAKDSAEVWRNYLNLFHELIPNELNELDPQRAYTSTTPISNWGTPDNFNYGTMHYWGVWHGKEPFENFDKNVGRFMVEYGFQSFPEIETLKKVMADSSLNLNSVAMKNRQKSYIGNGLIEKHVEQYYWRPRDFEEFVELSQKTQAKGMEMAIQAHRKAMPHCMGTLFWQLNDCWPGPSWSVIDYYGNEKLAYEVVKQNYDHILIMRDNNMVTVLSDKSNYSGSIVASLIKKNGKEIKLTYPFYFKEEGVIIIDLTSKLDFERILKKGKLQSIETGINLVCVKIN